MSVFSFSKTDRVWGLQRGAAMDAIEWWIEKAGPKPYLLAIQRSYEHGYNHGNLCDVADQDKAELLDLVQMMIRGGYPNHPEIEASHAHQIRQYLVELQELIEIDLADTPFERRKDQSMW